MAKVMKLCTAKIFSSSMILQRGHDICIHGTSLGNCRVTSQMSSDTESLKEPGHPAKEFSVSSYTVSDSSGSWVLRFPAMEAGGPYSMVIKAAGEKLQYSDIYIGDVWICAGQSNMTIPMSRVCHTYPEEMEAPYLGTVRMLTIPEICAFEGPREELAGGSWMTASPKTISAFSAVAWFFGTEIHRKEQIPIGLIVAAVGGTPIHSWLPREALQSYPDLLSALEPFRSTDYRETLQSSETVEVDSWFNKLDSGDRGLIGEVPWHHPDYDCSGWEETDIPSSGDRKQYPGGDKIHWNPEELPDEHTEFGSFWFQRDIDIAGKDAAQDGWLWLGRIIDSDTVWLNGTMIGTTGYQYPPRIYRIPRGIIQEGKNRITVRVIAQNHPVAFVPDKPYFLEVGNTRFSLEGTWKYRIGSSIEMMKEPTRLSTKPECLFNGMIAPLLRTPVTGICWYQGESNIQNSHQYHELLLSLMEHWRRKWDSPKLPFIIAQLPGYCPDSDKMEESDLAVIRESQRLAGQTPNATTAVTLDCGEWNDIHPLRKKPVGNRLAGEALHLVYRRRDIARSPNPVTVVRTENHCISIRFSGADNGLILQNRDHPLHLFISSEDMPFRRAQAEVSGDTLLVKDVPESVCTIRYAWADNPAGAALYNREGLPASPFQLVIDSWKELK